MLFSHTLSTLFSTAFSAGSIASTSTPWSLASIANWLSSSHGYHMSEPLWLATWGATLIAASMLSRSVGHRLDARRHPSRRLALGQPR